MPIVIAIDGPSASGKSTNARLVARELGYIYVDTGAMYRAFGWFCLNHRVQLEKPRSISAALRRWKPSLVCVENTEKRMKEVRLLVDGYYPEKEIRTGEVSAAASKTSAVPAVRKWMKVAQQGCVQFGNLVMEGRDIGTNVFPETNFKFFIDASSVERARRRAAEGVTDNLAERDRRDSQRAAAPLMIPLGAMRIETTGQTPEQTYALIVAEVKRRLNPASQG
jgi:cytidylate kinase